MTCFFVIPVTSGSEHPTKTAAQGLHSETAAQVSELEKKQQGPGSSGEAMGLWWQGQEQLNDGAFKPSAPLG